MLVSPLLPGMLFMTSRRARRSPLRCFRAGRLPMLKRSAVSTRFSQSRRMWVFKLGSWNKLNDAIEKYLNYP